MNTALASPTYHDLIGLLANERRVLERLLFKHAEISMLIAAGEHRFLGRAIDEALEVESDLAACDLMRAVLITGLSEGMDETDMTTLISKAPGEFEEPLEAIMKDMKRLVTQVDRYRHQAAAWAGERAEEIRTIIDRAGSGTYGDRRFGS